MCKVWCILFVTDKVSGKIDHTGPKTNFRNEVEFTWAPSQTVSVTSTFSMANGITLTSNFNAPEGMTGTMTFSHTGNWQKWDNRAEMTIGNGAPMAVYSEFDKTQTKAKVGKHGATYGMRSLSVLAVRLFRFL